MLPLLVNTLRIRAHSSGTDRIQLLLCISLIKPLLELFLLLVLQLLLVLENSERTELIQVLGGQPVLAKTFKQALVSIQDATLLQRLQS